MIKQEKLIQLFFISGIVFLEPLGAIADSAIFKLADRTAPISSSVAVGDKIHGHKAVIEDLMTRSIQAQADFVGCLDEFQSEGKIDSFRAFWIVNAVEVFGPPEMIENLERHPDVISVSANYPVEVIEPVDESQEFATSNGPEPGLEVVGAPAVWAFGLDGSGSLVCNFDTGVNGNHPALASKYRGNHGGEPNACWLDPYFNTPYPEDDHGHGTHTMGTMVGSAGSDTVGIAPGAQWIAAAVVSRGGDGPRTVGDILVAFQWAADPDGDPNTSYDVPDVVNNSWGIPVGYYPACEETFWNAIDNLEAAGTVCVFSAGNEGPSASTVRIPADRITTGTNAFSVGSVYGLSPDLPISEFSSRGPSGCDSITIKPEVTAPGSSIRSTDRNGGYSVKSGTSMAAPHVSGAVAILRQFNPASTPDEIKQALMLSARDLGDPGEDNTYGWGVIDIRKALNYMPAPAQPVIAAVSVGISGDGIMMPGEETSLEFLFVNLGASSPSLTAYLSSDTRLVEAESRYLQTGNLPYMEEGTVGPWIVRISPQANLGDIIELYIDFSLQDWECRARWVIVVGGNAVAGLASHDNGQIALSFSNFGQFGLGPSSLFPMGGVGFRYPSDSPDYLKNGSLLLATDSLRVSDATISDDPWHTDSDFAPKAGAYPRLIDPGIRSGQDGLAGYDDSAARFPIGLDITQNSLCWVGSEVSHFIVLEYVIRNSTDQTVTGLYAGLFCDWNTPLGGGRDDIVGYIDELSLGYIANGSSSSAVGIKLLTGQNTVYAAIENSAILANGFTGPEKYLLMSQGSEETSFEFPSDYSHLLSAGPFTLPAGESVVVAFALIGGTSLEELAANALESVVQYRESSAEDGPPLPGGVSIQGNYPNPFNAETRITLDGICSGDEIISIYNIEGRLIQEIPIRNGNEVVWSTNDKDGRILSSGMFFAKIRGRNGPAHKMILLK